MICRGKMQCHMYLKGILNRLHHLSRFLSSHHRLVFKEFDQEISNKLENKKFQDICIPNIQLVHFNLVHIMNSDDKSKAPILGLLLIFQLDLNIRCVTPTQIITMISKKSYSHIDLTPAGAFQVSTSNLCGSACKRN